MLGKNLNLSRLLIYLILLYDFCIHGHKQQYWEAGGHYNTAIAATRLRLRCLAIGHVGSEIYGRFLLDVLHDE
ncbi:5-dehydro-2-deoxygluconokinase 2 [Bienertia sinuspersici]